MTSGKPNAISAHSRGVAIIEFAVVLPLLLLLVLGVIEMSLLLYDQAMITNASRVGARLGITLVDGGASIIPDDDIEAAVDKYLTGHMISFAPDAVNTTITRVGASPTGHVTVHVEYSFTFLVFPNFVAGVSDGITLSADTVMRME